MGSRDQFKADSIIDQTFGVYIWRCGFTLPTRGCGAESEEKEPLDARGPQTGNQSAIFLCALLSSGISRDGVPHKACWDLSLLCKSLTDWTLQQLYTNVPSCLWCCIFCRIHSTSNECLSLPSGHHNITASTTPATWFSLTKYHSPYLNV